MPYLSSTIHYTRTGNGSKTLVCIHGYDENALSFALLCEHIQQDYSCICIDLPYHGATQWQQREAFTQAALGAIIEAIFIQEKIAAPTYTLAGYSIGGRIALSLFEKMPQRIERLVLWAPDGFSYNFWYWLSTQTFIGNKLFSYTVKNPAWILQLAKGLKAVGIINLTTLKLARHYLQTETLRKQLYARWTCFRRFRPDLEQVIQVAKKQHTQIRMVFGKFDHIIEQKSSHNFCKALEPDCKMTLINAGHHLLREQYMAALAEQLHN